MELKERYAIYPGRQVVGISSTTFAVVTKYNSELKKMKEAVNGNTRLTDNEKYYANRYIDSIIELNNKAAR